MSAHSPVSQRTPPVSGKAALSGAVAGVALLGWYLGLISLAQGFDHAIEQYSADAPFVLAVTGLFAAQVAMFVELRRIAAAGRRSGTVTTAATATSGVAMLACCAHHVADVLPLLGVSAAAVFLDTYKIPLLGLGVNVAGVVLLWRRLQQARRADAPLGPSASLPFRRRQPLVPGQPAP